MEQRRLGRTGLSVSILGYGAEPLGRRGRSFEDASAALNGVLDLGINLIDTAAAYGHSEAYIGKAIAHRKNDFTLVTKCGWIGDYQAAWSPAQLQATIDASLATLNMDYVDVLLLHSCDLELLRSGGVIEAVQKAQDAGKARFIGYSGDNEALDFAVRCGAFDVIECSLSILDQANTEAIANAERMGIGVMAKRPIANAVPGRSKPPRSEYAAQYWPRWQAFERAWDQHAQPPELTGDHWLETALRFTGFHPGVAAVLVGSTHVDHMRQNASILARGPLPRGAVEQLQTAWSAVGAGWPALG